MWASLGSFLEKGVAESMQLGGICDYFRLLVFVEGVDDEGSGEFCEGVLVFREPEKCVAFL